MWHFSRNVYCGPFLLYTRLHNRWHLKDNQRWDPKALWVHKNMNDIVSHVVYDRSHTHFPDRKQLLCTDVCHESWKLCNISHEAVGYQRSRTMLFRSQRFYNTYTNHKNVQRVSFLNNPWLSCWLMVDFLQSLHNVKSDLSVFLFMLIFITL